MKIKLRSPTVVVKIYPAGQKGKYHATFDERDNPPRMDYVVHVTRCNKARTQVHLSCWYLPSGDLYKVCYGVDHSLSVLGDDWWGEVSKVQITKAKSLMLRNLHKV